MTAKRSTSVGRQNTTGQARSVFGQETANRARHVTLDRAGETVEWWGWRNQVRVDESNRSRDEVRADPARTLCRGDGANEGEHAVGDRQLRGAARGVQRGRGLVDRDDRAAVRTESARRAEREVPEEIRRFEAADPFVAVELDEILRGLRGAPRAHDDALPRFDREYLGPPAFEGVRTIDRGQGADFGVEAPGESGRLFGFGSQQ